MKKFNPFQGVSCQYGAPMGRRGDNPANLQGVKKLRAKHMGKREAGYGNGGAYWGTPQNVWGVWTWLDGEAVVTYVRAWSREEAINKVQEG